MRHEPCLKDSRILLIEDEANLRQSIELVLKTEGYRVHSFASAEEALQAFDAIRPHMVLMDVILEGMDGIEATSQLIEKYGPRLPVVMLTGVESADVIDAAFEAGAIDYITKPIKWNLLTRRTEVILRRIHSERSSRESRQRFEAVFNESGFGILLVDREGTILEANPAALHTLSISGDKLLSQPYRILFDEHANRQVQGSVESLLSGEVHKSDIEVMMKDRHGKEFCASLSLSCKFDEQKQPEFIVIIFRDISRRKAAENQLRMAAQVFHSASEGVMITDAQGTILDVNQAFSRLTEYEREEAIGHKPSLLASGRQSADFYRQFWQQLLEQGSWNGEMWNRRKGGEIYPEHLSVNAVTDDSGEVVNYVAVFSDISGLKESEKRLKYLAYHDPLTGLANRGLFEDRIEHAIDTATRNNTQLALLYIDLDAFKAVNDKLGHDVGDELLEQVAQRLRKCVRENDTVARLGGDEFAVLMEQVCHTEDSRRVSYCILQALQETFIIHDHSINISASIGISTYPSEADTPEQLLVQADRAMYQAKRSGKGQVVEHAV